MKINQNHDRSYTELDVNTAFFFLLYGINTVFDGLVEPSHEFFTKSQKGIFSQHLMLCQ